MKSLLLVLGSRRYFSLAFIFLSLNMWFATWAIYIPRVKNMLELTKFELGIAISFLSAGVFLMFPLTPYVIQRLGLGRANWVSVIFCTLTALLPLSAPSFPLLCASLLLFGASNGLLDISMNTLASEMEQKDEVHIMSTLHGFFSLGGVVAGLGSFLVPRVPHPALHMLLVVLLVFAVNALMRKEYITVSAPVQPGAKIGFRDIRPLLFLGLIGFVSFGSEGAIVDWSGLFLREISLAPEQIIGSGLILFSLFMTLGRFLGDYLSQLIGSRWLLIGGACIVVTGYVWVLFRSTSFALLGFSLTGIGFSVMVPEIFRLAGRQKAISADKAVAFVAGSGYTGFLTAPILLGFLADSYSVYTSFQVLCAAAFLVLILLLVKLRS